VAYPSGLLVAEHPGNGRPGDGRPVVVLVHGALDRGISFRRTARRLPDCLVVTYDRRGYQGSRSAGGPMDLTAHAADLVAVATEAGAGDPVTAVGHSFGGDVVVAAALAHPERFAALAAYEPPMPWLGLRRSPSAPPAPAVDPAEEAEAFFLSMVGEEAWRRLPERARQGRRDDGPALVADLRSFRAGAPFDVTALRVPSVFACGGPATADHHRRTVAWLAEHVPGARLVRLAEAGHGAHLSHPDAFAALVRQTVEVGRTARAASPAVLEGAGP